VTTAWRANLRRPGYAARRTLAVHRYAVSAARHAQPAARLMPARMLVAFRAGLLPTSAALAVLHMISAQPGRAAEVTVLLIASLADAVIRFAFYRRRVFRRKAAALLAPGCSGWVQSILGAALQRAARDAGQPGRRRIAGDAGGLFPLMGPSEAAQRTFTTPPGSLLLCIRRHRRRTYRRRQR
jgi:hypothetical protein